MSGEPPLRFRRPAGDDGPLPAEIALGLEEVRRPLADLRQEAEVAAWEARFAALADELEPVTPPPGAFREIERAIAPEPVGHAGPHPIPYLRRLGLWKGIAGVCGAVAAAAVGLLLLPEAVPWRRMPGPLAEGPPPVEAPFAPPVPSAPTPPAASPPPPPAVPLPAGPRLVAAVAPGPGQAAAFVATYDPGYRQILLVPATRLRAPPAGHTPELWLVPPEGGAPVPLGRVDPSRAHTVDVPERFVPHARTGAALLVTFEPRGPETGRVRGPTFARGRLSAL